MLTLAALQARHRTAALITIVSINMEAQHAAAAARLIAARTTFFAAHETKQAAAVDLIAAAEDVRITGQQARDRAQAAVKKLLNTYAPRNAHKEDIVGAFEPPQLVSPSAFEQLAEHVIATKRAALTQLMAETADAPQKERQAALRTLYMASTKGLQNARLAALELLDFEHVPEPGLTAAREKLSSGHIFSEARRS
jgi:hypothetical protein